MRAPHRGEAVGDPAEQADRRGDRLDPGAGEAVGERRRDALPIVPDRAGDRHEAGQPAAPGPGEPGLEEGDPRGAAEGERPRAVCSFKRDARWSGALRVTSRLSLAPRRSRRSPPPRRARVCRHGIDFGRNTPGSASEAPDRPWATRGDPRIHAGTAWPVGTPARRGRAPARGEVRLPRAGVERPPAPATLARVIAGTAPPAEPAAGAIAPPEPDRHDERTRRDLKLDVLDDRPLDTEQPRPYPHSAHAVLRPGPVSQHSEP